MTILKFSKTRLCYYQNNNSTLKRGVYTGFKINDPAITRFHDFKSVSVPGVPSGTATVGHYWHELPTNLYGLYATFGEMQAVIFNSGSITPKKINIDVSNTIPLSRIPSGTGTSTVLSFNNTIPTFIHEHRDHYFKTDAQIDSTYESMMSTLFRTFDGVSAANATDRIQLPQPDWVFRIPFPMDSFSDDLSIVPPQPDPGMTGNFEYIKINGADATLVGSTAFRPNLSYNKDLNLTLNDIIDAHIPEPLQNNDDTFVLYPGENVYSFSYAPSNNKLCTIDLSGPNMFTTLMDNDVRMQNIINHDRSIPEDDILMNNVFPQYFGNPDLILRTFSGANNFDEFLRNINGSTDISTLKGPLLNTLRSLYYSLTTSYNITSNKVTSGEYFTDPIPIVLIKGCPIVDNTNALVPHEFLAFVTWSLEIEVTDNPMAKSSRLQWALTSKDIKRYISELQSVAVAERKYGTTISYLIPRKAQNASFNLQPNFHLNDRLWNTADENNYFENSQPTRVDITNYSQRSQSRVNGAVHPGTNLNEEITAPEMLIQPTSNLRNRYKGFMPATEDVSLLTLRSRSVKRIETVKGSSSSSRKL